MARIKKKTDEEIQKQTPQEKLKDLNDVLFRVGEINLEAMSGLENSIIGYIRSGDLDLAGRLSVKLALDHNIRTIEKIQVIDAKIRRLISEGPEDSMEKAAYAFLDKDRVITD